jgi:hypothetical protein
LVSESLSLDPLVARIDDVLIGDGRWLSVRDGNGGGGRGRRGGHDETEMRNKMNLWQKAELKKSPFFLKKGKHEGPRGAYLLFFIHLVCSIHVHRTDFA